MGVHAYFDIVATHIELASAKHMVQAMDTVLCVYFSNGRPKGLIKYGKGFDNDFT